MPGEEIFWEKNVVSRTIVGGSRWLPNRINPLYYLFCFARNKGRARTTQNAAMALHMSYVINGMSNEEKQWLTVSSGDVKIPPQQSFVDFFRLQNLQKVNPADFIQGFIHLFNKNRDEWFYPLQHKRHATINDVNDFWSKFLILVEMPSVTMKSNPTIQRANVSLVGLFQKIRRLFRVVLSGTGRFD